MTPKKAVVSAGIALAVMGGGVAVIIGVLSQGNLESIKTPQAANIQSAGNIPPKPILQDISPR